MAETQDKTAPATPDEVRLLGHLWLVMMRPRPEVGRAVVASRIGLMFPAMPSDLRDAFATWLMSVPAATWMRSLLRVGQDHDATAAAMQRSMHEWSSREPTPGATAYEPRAIELTSASVEHLGRGDLVLQTTALAGIAAELCVAMQAAEFLKGWRHLMDSTSHPEQAEIRRDLQQNAEQLRLLADRLDEIASTTEIDLDSVN